jgi:outer membrane protein assembly factor BamB
MSLFRILATVHILLLATTTMAADWSAFRGAEGNGIAKVSSVPTEWSGEQNIKWKMPLPGDSNGSPIVSNGRVFVTSAEDEGKQRHLHCFNAADGASLWVRTVKFDRVMPTHQTNQYGGSTPAANGQHVVVWHSSAGLYCYDFEGNEVWHRDLGEYRHEWGYGSSPVLSGDRVILHSGPGEKVMVGAYDLQTGQTLWQVDEPVEGNGYRNNDNQYMGSWCTPVIVNVEGKTLAVCGLSTRVNAYDVETGETVWTCDGLRGPRGDLCYVSPVIVDDICVVMGGFKGPAIGFRMGGSGNITDERRLWREEQGNPQRIGSGVVVDGMIYMPNAGPNTIQCIDPATGRIVWQERSPGSANWGSMVYAAGHLYVTDQDGTTHVIKPSTEGLQVVASNRLGESSNSTPAIIEGGLILRTFDHLYCIGE